MLKRIILVVLTATLITALLSMRGMRGLDTTLGQVWERPTLVAPFDIPILKTKNQLENDKKELTKSYLSVYRLDTSATVMAKASPKLKEIYRQGVLSQNEWEQHVNGNLRITNGNFITTYPAVEIYSPNSAMDTLSLYGEQASVTPNLTYDEELNNSLKKDAIEGLSLTRGLIRTGEVILSKNELIDQQKQLLLESYLNIYEQRVGSQITWMWVTLGRFIIVLMVLLMNVAFLEHRASLSKNLHLKPLLFTFMMYALMALMVAFTQRFDNISPLAIPLPIVAVYLLMFFNIRVAVYGNISVALICSLFVQNPTEFVLVNFLAGMVVIFMMRNIYHRADFFKAIGVTFAVEVVALMAIELTTKGILSIDTVNNVFYILINNLMLLALYQAVYLVEKIFNFVSDLTLLELSDTNQKLLLNLAHEAPGTFQHTVQVANLAEGAAAAIGARPLLARCGALYHDIGKKKNPFYFAENLSGSFNPHNDLLPQQSVEIIKAHVTDGVEIARKQGVPQIILDFIEQHHGNSLIYFFYSKALEKAKETGEVINEADFRYPGVNPISKETSICMMADAVEASSRSLPSYEHEPLEKLVDSIIDTQIRDGLLQNSELTFAEVGTIKSFFKQKLNNIYHARIAYPERKQ